ncbi:MAG: hypothetical protein E6G97_21285 [Alphaproteobacteria bacterium]|nr:MAG: hypothetical protein E6G97_21285 [Alphaproteobacteria bacterium]
MMHAMTAAASVEGGAHGMMIGPVDAGVIALGIFFGMLAPFVFVMAIMSTDAPGSSATPAYTVMGGGVVLIALIAWWVDHPFQFFGGMALPFAYMFVAPLLERLWGNNETAAPEPPPRPIPCVLAWDGREVAKFEAGEGLPPETHPDTRSRVQPTHGSADAGTLTFRRGSSRNADFVQWCESGGARRGAARNAAAIGVQIFDQGKKVAEITLKGARPAQLELHATVGPARDVTDFGVLTIEYQAWKHAWEFSGWPKKKA